MNNDKDWALPYSPFMAFFMGLSWLWSLFYMGWMLHWAIIGKIPFWLAAFGFCVGVFTFVNHAVLLSRTKYAKDEAEWKQNEPVIQIPKK